MLGLSVKLYLRVLGLTAMSDPIVIFIILIITLNLHDLSLSGSGVAIALDVSLVVRSCHKSMIIK